MVLQVVPQFQINEIFEATPDALVAQQRALVIGPDYAVRKYSVNKNLVLLGAYTDASLVAAWPGRLAGEVVDQSFTSVNIDGAALRYHTDNNDTTVLTGTPNRLHSSTKSWATNGAFARSGSIPTDVLVGDLVRVTLSSNSQVSRVTGLLADVVPAVTAAAAAVGSNVATAAGSSSATLGSNTGTATAAISGLANPANYHGENVGTHGVMTETYTLTVTAVGAHGTGNAGNWDTVRLSVVSASGTDNVASLTPTPGAVNIIGTRGARVTLSHGGSGDDWAVGDVVTLAVTQTYTIPTIASGGTYTGPSDTIYVVRVTKGGASGAAQVTVSTSTGVDNGGPYTVTSGTPIVLGNYGVTLNFTGTTLVVGDSFTVAATAQTTGAIHTLILANDMASNLQGSPVIVELAIVKDIVVPANRIGHAPLLNWFGSATQITLNAGILSNDARVPGTDLEVILGTAYASYRALRTATASVVRDIATVADILAQTGGVDDPDSVLAYGLYRALSNAAGTVVKSLSVPTDNLAGYNAAMLKLKDREDWYRAVPLTHDEAIIDAVIAVCEARSTAVVGRWATAMISLALNPTVAVVGTGSQLATILDNPDAGGTQYTLVTDTAGQFITKGVRPGDIFRALYTADGFGGSTYSSFTVDTVVSEGKLLLLSGPSLAVTIPSTYQIWHNQSNQEQADDFGAREQARSNRRVTSSFPANPGRVGTTVPGYFLACSLAALRGASAPHQGLTNAAVADWDDMTEASVAFADQLDNLANYGTYIVTENPAGLVYIRKQLTTDISDTKHAEDSATVNCDSVAFYFKNLLAPFVGVSNVVPANIDQMTAEVLAGLGFLKTANFTTKLGAQITDGTLVFLRPHATLLDRVVARVQVDLPIPLNNGEMDLIV